MIKEYVKGLDGKIKEIIIQEEDGTLVKFIPEVKEEVVEVVVTSKKSSKK